MKCKYYIKNRYLMLVLLSIFLNKQASAQHELGFLKVGDKAPNFTVKDHNGNKINLNDKLNEGKVVMVFYRGAWCPYCNKHMSHLQDSLQLILNKGASLIAFSPEVNLSIDKTISKTKASFSIVYDSNYVVMKLFGTTFKLDDNTFKKYKLIGIDVEESNGNKDHILTVPATFVINRDGIIEYLHFDENYKKRSTVKEILSHL